MIVNSILEFFLMILSVFLIVLKIKDTWITFLYYHQLILWNDLAMYYKKMQQNQSVSLFSWILIYGRQFE